MEWSNLDIDNATDATVDCQPFISSKSNGVFGTIKPAYYRLNIYTPWELDLAHRSSDVVGFETESPKYQR